MVRVQFSRTQTETGKSFYLEAIICDNYQHADGSMQKNHCSMNFLGKTICGLLSMEDIYAKSLFVGCDYDFNLYENDICSIMRLLREFLNKQETTDQSVLFSAFKVFMMKNNLVIPQYRYAVNDKFQITEEYCCSSITELCVVLFHKVLQSGFVFRKCQNPKCPNWFVPQKKSDEKYCSVPSYNNPLITCKDLMRRDKVYKKRNRGSITWYLRIIRQMYYNPSGMIINGLGDNKQEFENGVMFWREKIKSGLATEGQFIDWLQSCYKTKYKQNDTKAGDNDGQR